MFVSSIGIKKYNQKPHTFISDLFVTNVLIDPASLATVTGAVTDVIEVIGAKLGDAVIVFPPPYNTRGIIYQGFVSADNAVRVSFFNPTAATIDLASGLWTIQVVRK